MRVHSVITTGIPVPPPVKPEGNGPHLMGGRKPRLKSPSVYFMAAGTGFHDRLRGFHLNESQRKARGYGF